MDTITIIALCTFIAWLCDMSRTFIVITLLTIFIYMTGAFDAAPITCIVIGFIYLMIPWDGARNYERERKKSEKELEERRLSLKKEIEEEEKQIIIVMCWGGYETSEQILPIQSLKQIDDIISLIEKDPNGDIWRPRAELRMYAVYPDSYPVVAMTAEDAYGLKMWNKKFTRRSTPGWSDGRIDWYCEWRGPRDVEWPYAKSSEHDSLSITLIGNVDHPSVLKCRSIKYRNASVADCLTFSARQPRYVFSAPADRST
jgi:hypothetical protein